MENVKNVAYGTHVTVIDKIDTEPVKLRVAAYARVSSDSEDQLNSYIAQVDFYTKYITTHEGWELVDIYADEGLTGMETKHRDDFNRMIQDCRDGKIDRVLVKSVSRFARNTQEYILYMRELLRLGVTIYFEKENLDTGKMSNEQAADIYGAFAQMETTGHSQNMRVSNRIRMEKGLFTPPTAPYGYRLKDKELVIIPEEAEVIRYIFHAFLNGSGRDIIARELNNRGVKKKTECDTWYPSSIGYILKNITYTGNQIWQKYNRTDVIPFRQVRNKGSKPKYYVEKCCPAIITQEEFDLTQELIRKREGKRKTQNICPNPFKGHIYCAECGCVCRTKIINEKTYWVCRRRDQGKQFCQVPQVSDAEIRNAIQNFCLKMISGKGTILIPAMDSLRELRELSVRKNRKVADIDEETAKLTQRDLVLTKLKTKGYMDPAIYISERSMINRRTWELRKLRRNILESSQEDETIRKTEMMLEYLESENLPDPTDSNIFTMLIEKMHLAPNGQIQITAINGMTFTESLGRTVRK